MRNSFLGMKKSEVNKFWKETTCLSVAYFSEELELFDYVF